MLVLSRKVKETIVIPGSNIRLTVVEIRGHKVRLGFDAPPHVAILRGELDPDSPPPEAAVPSGEHVGA